MRTVTNRIVKKTGVQKHVITGYRVFIYSYIDLRRVRVGSEVQCVIIREGYNRVPCDLTLLYNY